MSTILHNDLPWYTFQSPVLRYDGSASGRGLARLMSSDEIDIQFTIDVQYTGLAEIIARYEVTSQSLILVFFHVFSCMYVNFGSKFDQFGIKWDKSET